MKIKIAVIIFSLFFVLVLGLLVLYFLIPDKQTEELSKTNESLITQEIKFTKYTNKKFGFEFAYPEKWGLPQESDVLPAQERVYQISFSNTPYTLNLFNQLLPVSQHSFLRNYFGEKLIWSADSQSPEGVIFAFSDDQSLSGQRSGFVSQKGKYILLITKDAQLDSISVTKDEILANLFTSANWLEN